MLNPDNLGFEYEKLLPEEHYIRIHKSALDVVNVYVRAEKDCPHMLLVGHRKFNDYLALDVSAKKDDEDFGVLVTGILQKPPQSIIDALGVSPEIACLIMRGEVSGEHGVGDGYIFSIYSNDAHGMSFSKIENRDGLNGVHLSPITFDFKKEDDGYTPVSGGRK